MALSMAIPLSGLELEHFDNVTSFLVDQKLIVTNYISNKEEKDGNSYLSECGSDSRRNNNDNNNSTTTSQSSGTGRKSIAKVSRNRRRRQHRARKIKNKSDSSNADNAEPASDDTADSLPPPINFFDAFRSYRQLLTPQMIYIDLRPVPFTPDNLRRLSRSFRDRVKKTCEQPKLMYRERNILNLEANLRSFNWQVTWKVDQDNNCAGIRGPIEKNFNDDVSTFCSQCDFNEPHQLDRQKKK